MHEKAVSANHIQLQMALPDRVSGETAVQLVLCLITPTEA